MNSEGYNMFMDEYYPVLRQRAAEQGLYAFTYKYRLNDPTARNSGYYFVTCPDPKYEDLLRNTDGYMDRLIANKEKSPSTFFDANFCFAEIGSLKGNDFNTIMNIMRDTDTQAFAVNAFRHEGYSEFPSTISENAVFEMERMHLKVNDNHVLREVRDRYRESYSKFVGYVYAKSMDISKLTLSPQKKARKQIVKDPAFFVKNKVPTDCIEIDQGFRPYFEEAIKQFPQFYYYMEKKPILNLDDISDKVKGEVARKEWEITFPLCYQEIFYTIVNQYNNRNLPGKVENRYELGDPSELMSINISQWDMDNFAALASANGVKFYVNKGDVAPITRDNFWDNNVVLFHEDDSPTVNKIMSRLATELSDVRRVDITEVNNNKTIAYKNQKKISTVDHLDYISR